MIENPIRMVRELKGAPLSILFALSIVQMRVSQEYLERVTGYTDKPLALGIGYLAEIGLVDKTSSGWGLTGAARQLPLTLGLPEEVEAQEVIQEEKTTETQSVIEDEPELVEDNSGSVYQSRNNSDSRVRTTINSIKSLDNLTTVVRTGEPEKRKNSDPEPDSEEPETKPEVWAELERAGIRRNRRVADIVSRDYVTVEYIQFHRSRLEGAGKAFPRDAALLIRVLGDGDTGPKDAQHKKGCMCDVCRKKFTRWAQSRK